MKWIIGLVAGSLLALVLVPAESKATIPSCLRIKGTLLGEGESNDDPVLFKQQLRKVRFSEKDFLAALGAPKGACIQVVPEDLPIPDGVFLVDANGVVLQDLSAFASVDLATEINVFSGSFNNDTFAESSLILFRISISLEIGDIEIEVDGVAFEKFKSGAMDEDGDQKVKATIKAKFSGQGTRNGKLAFAEGTVALTGKGEFNFQ